MKRLAAGIQIWKNQPKRGYGMLSRTCLTHMLALPAQPTSSSQFQAHIEVGLQRQRSQSVQDCKLGQTEIRIHRPAAAHARRGWEGLAGGFRLFGVL